MSNDSFTEVTSQSWLTRLGGAFKGIVLGLVLIVVAFPVLFNNEGRAVKRYKTLKEGAGSVITVPADRVDDANSGKLVHVTGKATTDATLIDPLFGVSANALKLKRVVEMYQWRESSTSSTKKKLGGGTETKTEYTYTKVWSESPINSSNFKMPAEHENPNAIQYEAISQTADEVKLGAYVLSPSLVGKINNFVTLPVDSETPLPEGLKTNANLHASGFYFGESPTVPAVGDMKVKWLVANPTEVSVVAKQVASSFEPYPTEAGGVIELLQIGTSSADAMIQQAQDSNKKFTIVIRVVGFVLMFLGFAMIFKPLSVLADVLPILGTIVGAGTGLISFMLAAVLSLITIGIGWLAYRPLLGVLLIAGAGGLAFAIFSKLKAAKTTKATEASA